MIESIEKPQESIRKNRNPHRVIPAQAGIQKHNAAGLYRKKQTASLFKPQSCANASIGLSLAALLAGIKPNAMP
ncbi:hypothetical protein FYM48_10180, partial [Neisseria meningitidis]